MRAWRSTLNRHCLAALLVVLTCGATVALAQSDNHETTVRGHYWLPDAVSSFGKNVDLLFNYILYLTVAINIAVFAALIIFLIKYRYKAGRHATFIHGNNKLETVWTLVPTIILALTAAFSESLWSEMKVPPKSVTEDKETIHIEVVAQQFLWNFHYGGKDGRLGTRKVELINQNGSPDEQIGLNRGVNIELKSGGLAAWGTVDSEDDKTVTLSTKLWDDATKTFVDGKRVIEKSDIASRDNDGADDFVTNVLYIPVNRKVYIHLNSRDVIHSFFVPNFRVKQDAVPGMTTRVWLEAQKTSAEAVGTNADGSPKPFDIACAELCGQGHFKMHGQMYVVTAEQFQKFLDDQSKSAAGDNSGF